MRSNDPAGHGRVERAGVHDDAGRADPLESRGDIGAARGPGLENVDFGGEAGEQRRRVTGAPGDVEDAVARLDASTLDQPRQDQRRQQVARLGAVQAGWNVDAGVRVGEVALGVGDEALARHREDAVDQLLVGDVEGPDLAVDHGLALRRGVLEVGRESGLRHRGGPPAVRTRRSRALRRRL